MRKHKWLRSILILVAAVFAASAGFSRALRTAAARRYLVAHLEASFGRPVEVGRFDFSLLDGARLEAHSVTVFEDPHFGNEYFVRAESLRAGLRWSALFLGRFEFGTLSLVRPSLNLVRDAQGRWNIESWLPPAPSPPGFVGPSAPVPGVPPARLVQIDVQDGRINFKQGEEKSRLALLGVTGRVERNAAGRWQLDLEARPMRAGVELQDIGTLRVRGSIAGTSARLQPAELNLTWRDVSLADLLRLTRQSDSGVRGELSLDLSARIEPSSAAWYGVGPRPEGRWAVSAIVRARGIHGWALPGRAGDPAVNLAVEATAHLGEARAQISKFLIEMPGSHLEGSGDLDWWHGFYPRLHIESSSLGLGDAVAWYRAFRPGVSENLDLQGNLNVDATLEGWPLRVVQGALAGGGARLTGASPVVPLQIGPINASASRGGWIFAPTMISVSAAGAEAGDGAAREGSLSNFFTIQGAVSWDHPGLPGWLPDWTISVVGGTSRLEDWLALSRSLARPLPSGWKAAGGVTVNLQGTRRAEVPEALWLGTADFRDLAVTPVFLNQPLRFPRTHLELAKAQRTITLLAAEALGTSWRGTISRKIPDGQWIFDLTADRLDAVDLDRWLGPRARPGLLARFRSFGTPPEDSAGREAAVGRISIRGRLRATQIVISPLHLEQFDSQAVLEARTLTIRKASADFFGGKVTGELDARLFADPSYRFQGRFDRVDLARLGHAVAALNNRVSGTASAVLTLGAHGVGRENLLRSIEGEGKLEARNAGIGGLELAASAQALPKGGRLLAAQGSFRVGKGKIEVLDLMLSDSSGRFQAEGNIGFSHALNVRIHPVSSPAASSQAHDSLATFLLGGTVEAPQLVRENFPDAPDAAPHSAAR